MSNKRAQEHQYAQVAKGLCMYCSEPLKTKWHCVHHAKMHSLRGAEWRERNKNKAAPK